MLRDLEMCDFAAAKMPDLVFGGGLARFETDPGKHRFAEPLIRQAHYLYVGNLRVAVKKLLNLTRIYIFASANNHVLGAASDAEITVATHHAEVARVQPAVRVDCLARCLRLTVVAPHYQIAACAELALLAYGLRLARFRRDDFHLGLRKCGPHS